MIIVFTIILCCLVTQIIIVNRYKNFDNKKSTLNFLSEPRDNTAGQKILYKLMEFQSGIYQNQIKKNNREMFFATLVHDLKTPANAQIHSIELLLAGKFGNLNDSQRQILKETLYSEKYMSEIISNILTSYKYDYDKVKLDKSVFNIVKLTNDVCNTLAQLAAEQNLNISLLNYEKQIDIFADKLKIQRVITNLISNAIKYSKKNSEIKITLEATDGNINFSVINKSFYIPKYKLAKVFDKFSGYKESGLNSASTGLGLYLSKKIIELHGGRIYAESFTEGTCIFGFNLKRISAPGKYISSAK